MRIMLEAEALINTANNAKYSCTAVIGESVLFFGGQGQDRQISQLTPFGLIRIGALPFTFTQGTCLVIESQLFLGFTVNQEYSCWSRLAVLNSESCENLI